MHKLGIIIPFRDRYEHLQIFKKSIRKYFEKLDIKYELIIIEQDDAKLFNRGKLLNNGFLYAKKMNCDYVVFNDVDMLPVDVDYNYEDYPVHWEVERHICENPKLYYVLNVVTGEKTSPSGNRCYNQRITEMAEKSLCGSEGKLFEPK